MFSNPKSYLAPFLRLKRSVGYENEIDLPKKMKKLTLSNNSEEIDLDSE